MSHLQLKLTAILEMLKRMQGVIELLGSPEVIEAALQIWNQSSPFIWSYSCNLSKVVTVVPGQKPKVN